jgi:hypothetical protein
LAAWSVDAPCGRVVGGELGSIPQIELALEPRQVPSTVLTLRRRHRRPLGRMAYPVEGGDAFDGRKLGRHAGIADRVHRARFGHCRNVQESARLERGRAHRGAVAVALELIAYRPHIAPIRRLRGSGCLPTLSLFSTRCPGQREWNHLERRKRLAARLIDRVRHPRHRDLGGISKEKFCPVMCS